MSTLNEPPSRSRRSGSGSSTASADDPFSQIFGDDNAPLTGAETRTERTRRERAAQRRAGGARRALVVVAIIAVLLLVIGLVGWFGFGDRIRSALGIDDNDYSGTGNGTEVAFTVEAGDTGTSIGERLHDEGVVKTAKAFVDEVISRSPEPTFIPGTYTMQLEMSAESAVDALLDESNRVESTFVVPEGTAMQDIFPLIEAGIGIPVADLEAAAADVASFGLPAEATSLEGFLFPATYQFDPGTDARTVLEAMVNRSFQALDEAGVAPEDRWFTIRLASLVQKEAGLRDDFYRVSRVFLNRLDIGMLMQSDATVAYGTGNTHRVETTDAERADASNPYNTYVHEGMVFAPISNPGDLAIDAAVNPAEGQWLYFVTWNLETGETIFSNTWEEHEAAVAKWQAWMAEHPEYS